MYLTTIPNFFWMLGLFFCKSCIPMRWLWYNQSHLLFIFPFFGFSSPLISEQILCRNIFIGAFY